MIFMQGLPLGCRLYEPRLWDATLRVLNVVMVLICFYDALTREPRGLPKIYSERFEDRLRSES